MKLADHAPPLVEVPVLRSVPRSDVGHVLYTPRRGRAPKNVPTSVDNLWEWCRPRRFPSRRASAFGSPTPELAGRYGPSGGVICRVALAQPFRLAQLRYCPDAREHPDVEALAKLVADLERDHRATVATLKKPLAGSDLINRALMAAGPRWVEMFREAVTFWSTAELVSAGNIGQVNDRGEFFFEAPNGYALLPLTR